MSEAILNLLRSENRTLFSATSVIYEACSESKDTSRVGR